MYVILKYINNNSRKYVNKTYKYAHTVCREYLFLFKYLLSLRNEPYHFLLNGININIENKTIYFNLIFVL